MEVQLTETARLKITVTTDGSVQLRQWFYHDLGKADLDADGQPEGPRWYESRDGGLTIPAAKWPVFQKTIADTVSAIKRKD